MGAWHAKYGMVDVRIIIEDETLLEIEVCASGLEFVPGCEAQSGQFDGECMCRLTDDLEEEASVICPWRVLEETGEGGGAYPAQVPIVDGRITRDAMRKLIADTVHPEFGDGWSLLNLASLKWRLMDGSNNDLIFEGIKR